MNQRQLVTELAQTQKENAELKAEVRKLQLALVNQYRKYYYPTLMDRYSIGVNNENK